MYQDKTRALFIKATVAVYLASFFLPSWHDSRESSGGGWDGPAFGGHPISGARAFVMSLFVRGIPMWLANPAFWFGLYSLARGRPRAAKVSSVVAVLLAISELPFFWRELHVGYWLWLASMGSLLAFCFWQSPEEAIRPCPRSVRLVWAALGAVGLIIGILLMLWRSSFAFEDLHW
jgi:hypothetical protein